LETKKLSLLSKWRMERCELFTTKDSYTDLQLEAHLPRHADIRARIKAEQAEMFSKTTWQVGKLASPLKENLFRFLSKHGGNCEEEQVPSELAHLLVDG
jgi:hypothetical protein